MSYHSIIRLSLDGINEDANPEDTDLVGNAKSKLNVDQLFDPQLQYYHEHFYTHFSNLHYCLDYVIN